MSSSQDHSAEDRENRPEVDIDFDAAVWLRGPGIDATENDIAKWVSGAMYAQATDFDLENSKGGVEYREYVLSVLNTFARWDTQANITFLRFRYQGDRPTPLGIELYTAADVEEINEEFSLDLNGPTTGDAFVDLSLTVGGNVPTVGEVSREHVEDSAWERLVFWIEDPDEKAIESRVVYARRYAATGTVAIARFAGLSPARTVEILPDTDDLVRSISIGGEA